MMKQYRSYVNSAASALLCGSLAAGGLFFGAKLMPDQRAAGYEETTEYICTETTELTESTGTDFTETTDVTGTDVTETTSDPCETSESPATSTSPETATPPPGSFEASGLCGQKAQYNYDRMTGILTIGGTGKIGKALEHLIKFNGAFMFIHMKHPIFSSFYKNSVFYSCGC